MFPKRNLEKIVEKVAIDFNIEINYLSNNWIILLKKNNKIKQKMLISSLFIKK